MKKRVLSLFLSLALCVTVMPQTVYAEEGRTPTVSGNEGGVSQTGQNGQLAAVQSLIDALPTLEELQTADTQKQQEIYEALQEAYDAYEALSAEEQALLTGADCFETLFGWFNAQVSLLEEDAHLHCLCGKHKNSAECTLGITSSREWSSIEDSNGSGKIDNDELPTMTQGDEKRIYLTGDAELSSTYVIQKDTTLYLCLNGHSLTGPSGDAAIRVEGTLYLTDCKENGKVTHKTGESGSGISCEDTGTFVMNGGSISGNSATNGGGVSCAGNFYMNGGSISGNSAINGGGFYLMTTGSGATVHLKGGSISNNSATNGGGIYVAGESMSRPEIIGTNITDNKATENGGGICLGKGKLSIALCKLESGEIRGNSATNGGGVYGASWFEAVGGSITDNSATQKGGGVALSNRCTLGENIKISGNTTGEGTSATAGNLCFISPFGENFCASVMENFCGEVGLTVDLTEDEKSNLKFILWYLSGVPSGTIRLDKGGSIDETGNLVDHVHNMGTDGTCTVENCKKNLVASVTPSGGNAVYYTALSAAIAAAETGSTVTVLSDTNLTDNYKIAKGITLDLNGKTVKMNGTLFVLAENVIITDSSTYEGGIEDTDGKKVSVTVEGDLSVQGGTLGNIWVRNNKTFALTGGKFALTGGKVEGLTLSYGTVKLSGGKLGSISTDGSSKVKDLLETGYAIKKTVGTANSYLSVSEQESSQLAALTDNGYYEVVPAPLASVTAAASATEVTYNATNSPQITVTATKTSSYSASNITYQWYLDGEIESGETGETYTFSSDHNVKLDRGTVKPYTVKCEVTCDGYTVKVEKEITVKQADLSDAAVSVTGSPFTYRTSEYTLSNSDVEVKYNGKTLTGGTDYVIDDTSDVSATDARTYTVKIKSGTNTNYTGGNSAQWTIAPKQITASTENIILSGESFTYTGSPIAPEVTIKDGDKEIPEKEYTVVYENNTAVGTANIKITDKAGGNYTVSGSRTFTIGKAQNTATVSMANYTYGDTPSAPDVTGNSGNGTVTYYYSTENSTESGNQNSKEWKNMTATSLNAGTYYLYAEIAEDTNHKACTTAAVEFKVLQAEPTVTTWPTIKDVYVGEELNDSYLNGGSASTSTGTGAGTGTGIGAGTGTGSGTGAGTGIGAGTGTGTGTGVPGSFSITGTKSWNTSGNQTTELTFAPTDTTNYKTVTKQDANVKVVKRTVLKVTTTLNAIETKPYGTSLENLGLPGTVSIETADGKKYANIPVAWDSANLYNPQTLETQTLTGSLNLTDIANLVEQPAAGGTQTGEGAQPVTASIQVTLQKLTANTPTFANKTVTYDGAAKSLVLADADIPAGVEAVYYSYEGTDGTSYAKTETAPTNAGSYTVTASFTMENGYAPLDAITAKLTIARKNIAGADITLGAALTANGEQQTQTLAEVKLGDLTLTAEDYELSGNTASEAGEYTLIILGKGNYSGEATKSWTLAEAEESGGSEGSSTGESEESSGSEGSTVTPTSYSWPKVDAPQQNGNTVGGAVRGSRNINVSIPGGNIVPTYVLRTLCGTRLTLALQQGNGVALSISGDALNERNLSGVRMLDLTTDTNTGAIPEVAIQGRRTAGSRQLSIRDTGRFAIPVGLHVSMGAENAGRYANFYRYNEAQGRLEYCGSFRITESGQAMLALKQGGSYFINVTDTVPVEKYLFSADAYTVRSGDTLSRIARR